MPKWRGAIPTALSGPRDVSCGWIPVGGTIVAAPHCETFLLSLRPDKVIQLTSAWEHSILTGREFSQAIPRNQHWSWRAPILRLLPKFIPTIRRGEKRSTIRKGRWSIRPGLLLLESDDALLAVKVIEVVYKRFCDLTEEDARNDGFENLDSLQKELQMIYPNLSRNSMLTVISFSLIG